MSLNGSLENKSLSEQLTPFFYSFKRYWRICFCPAVLVFLITSFLAIKLPDYYTADAVIFIQPQRLASKIIDNPSDKEMQSQMEGLIQEFLSRPRLRAIIDQYKLYPEISGTGAAQRAIIKLKNDISIIPVKSETGTTTLQTFQLKYTHQDPQIAYGVTKTLSNLFVEESLIAKKSEAQGTEEFLDSKLRESRQQLEATENKVQGFVKENYGRLPDQLEAAVARLQNMQTQLSTNSQMLAANQMRRSNIDQELSIARKSAETVGSNENSGDPQERLAQLQSALVVLRSQYSDKHPDVIRTKARIEALQERLKSGGGSGGVGYTIDSPAVSRARRELGELDVQIKSLSTENERLRKDIIQLEKDIQEMPLKEQELAKIKRDYENKKAVYERLLAGREEAGLQGDLIRSQRAAQFRIVQPAELPGFPAGPNRILIIGIGILAALVTFSAIPAVLYFVNDSYKFREDIENELGVSVIGVIPGIDTPQAKVLRTKTLAFSLAFSVIFFVGFSVIVFVFI